LAISVFPIPKPFLIEFITRSRADRDSVSRREHADALAEKYGARIEQAYWTMGHYDTVAIIEAPDDETITAMILELTAEGNVRTSTLRAFDHDQMQAIVQRTTG
jgi:uncharacterized protein with GYD domain